MINAPTDHIHLQIILSSPEKLGYPAGPIKARDVGAQQLRELILGGDDPRMAIVDPDVRAVAQPLLDNLVELSIDESAHTKPEFTHPKQIHDFLSHWRGLMWPLMQSGNDVANFLDDSLAAEEAQTEPGLPKFDGDLAKLLGTLDVASIAICHQVEVPHAKASRPEFRNAAKKASQSHHPAFEFPEEIEDSGLLQLARYPIFTPAERAEMELLVAIGMNIGVRSQDFLERYQDLMQARAERSTPKYEELLDWYEHLFTGKLTNGWEELNRFLVMGPRIEANQQLFTSPAKEHAKLISRFMRALTIDPNIEDVKDPDPAYVITKLLEVERAILHSQPLVTSEAHGEYSDARISHYSLAWLQGNLDLLLDSGLMNNLTPQARKQVQASVDAIRAYQQAQADTA